MRVIYGGVVDLSRITGFEWDNGNERKSIDAHQVSQLEAEEIFFNQPLLVVNDERHSLAEPRWHALGLTDSGRGLHITFTLRQNRQKIRVISARDMSKKERRIYEEQN
jgi:uncharacterized DUF497 family protein